MHWQTSPPRTVSKGEQTSCPFRLAHAQCLHRGDPHASILGCDVQPLEQYVRIAQKCGSLDSIIRRLFAQLVV